MLFALFGVDFAAPFSKAVFILFLLLYSLFSYRRTLLIWFIMEFKIELLCVNWSSIIYVYMSHLPVFFMSFFIFNLHRLSSLRVETTDPSRVCIEVSNIDRLAFLQMALQTATPPTTPSAEMVGNAFVEQYYHILHQSPELVYRFYQESSVISRPDSNGVMTSVTTMKVSLLIENR
jgi:hypothetical protein